MNSRGRVTGKFLNLLSLIVVAVILSSILFVSFSQAATGSTNVLMLSTTLTVSPAPISLDAPVSTSLQVKTYGSSLTSGAMTVTLYCDMPVYLAIVGPGAPTFQYPGLPIDLSQGYKLKQSNVPISSQVNLPAACSYTGKGITYSPIVVVEHAGYAAWSSTTVKTNSVLLPSPTPSTTALSGDWQAELNGSVANTATAPFTDTLYAGVYPGATSQSGLLTSPGPFNYYLYCNGSAGTALTPAPDKTGLSKGSPYSFVNGCTYTTPGYYLRKVIIQSGSAYKYALHGITITDPQTTITSSLSTNPSSATVNKDVTLTAKVATNNITNTINYSFWWDCNYTADSYSAVVGVCGDPTNSAIGARFDNLSSATISKSLIHKYTQVKTFSPKVLIEQGNSKSTSNISLKVNPIPVLTPLLQAIDKGTTAGKKSIDLVASNSGARIQTNQDYAFWWNCNKGGDSWADTLSTTLGCGIPEPGNGKRIYSNASNPYTLNHIYAPGTYKAKVVIKRDNIEKAASVDIIVPAVASVVPSPSPSPSKIPSPSPSPSKTPLPSPSPSKVPSPSPSPSKAPSASPSPSKIPSPSPSPSSTPGIMTVALNTSPDIKVENQLVTVTSDVTDTNSAVASTNYTFWWHCDNPSTSVAVVMNDPSCGMPRVNGDTTTDTPERRANGFQINGYLKNGAIANQYIGTKNFPAGPRTIKVIVERRGQAIETRRAIQVNPNSLDASLVIQPAIASIGENVSIQASAVSTDTSSAYSYYFWWDCDNTSSSVEETSASSACGVPTDSSKGAQFVGLAASTITKNTSTTYSTSGVKKPKLIVVHGNLISSYVGEIEIAKPSLNIGLTVNPSSAEGESRNTQITATASGSATGSINYNFWWDCNDDSTDLAILSSPDHCGTPVDPAIGMKADGEAANHLTATHDYSLPGTYHPKVIVERGGADPVEQRAQIVITQAPQKTLDVSLSATQIGNSFPSNISFNTSLSGTASGPSNIKIWWDCQPDLSDLSKLSDANQCGDPNNSALGATAQLSSAESVKNFTHTYSDAGLRHPIVLAERDGVLNFQNAEIEIVGPQEPSPVPSSSPSPSSTPEVSPSPEASPADSINISAGWSVLGFNGDLSSNNFSDKGIRVFSYNQADKKWNIFEPGNITTFLAHKAYYLKSPSDTEVALDTPQSSESRTFLTSGWNFIWNNSPRDLNSLEVSLSDGGQCVAQDVPLGVLRSQGIIYKWIYVVANDRSNLACQAFSLLTGSDKPSPGCSQSNYLLNEISQVPANKGVWVYLFGNKISSFQTNQYTCE